MVKVIEAQVENNEKKQKNYKPLFITLMSLALVLITVVAAVLAIFVNKFKPLCRNYRVVFVYIVNWIKNENYL